MAEHVENVRQGAVDLHQAWLRRPGRVATRAQMRRLMGRWSGRRMEAAIADAGEAASE